MLNNSRSAAKALAAIPKADCLRVVEAIDLLCDTPAAGSALKGEFEGLRRLRVGHYRVVYEWQRSEWWCTRSPSSWINGWLRNACETQPVGARLRSGA